MQYQILSLALLVNQTRHESGRLVCTGVVDDPLELLVASVTTRQAQDHPPEQFAVIVTEADSDMGSVCPIRFRRRPDSTQRCDHSRNREPPDHQELHPRGPSGVGRVRHPV